MLTEQSRTDADVLVVGGGIIGLSCAWQLARSSCRVTLIESKYCTDSQSHTSLGVLAPPSPLKKSHFHRLHRESLAMLPEFCQTLSRDSGLDVCLNTCGMLELLPRESQLEMARKEVDFLNQCPSDNYPPLTLLNREQCRKILPSANITEFGALQSPAASTVEVDRLLKALYLACLQNNVEIVENCRVKALIRDSSRISGIHTEVTDFFADAVLICAGAQTALFDEELKTFAGMEPVRGQALLLEGGAMTLKHIIRWNRSYLVPWKDGQIAVGSSTERKAGFEVANTAGEIQRLLQAAIDVIPELRHARLIKTWSGLRPGSIDRKPYLGELPETRGLWIASGHYKIGFGFAPLTAMVMSELITTGRSSRDLSGLAPRSEKSFI